MLSTASPAVAVPLREVLAAEGFTPGAPPRVTPATLAIDSRSARSMKCAACRQRGLAFQPMRNAGGVYRVLCSCRRCGGEVEL